MAARQVECQLLAGVSCTAKVRKWLAADDPEGQARHATFLQGLQQSGWTVGRNLRINTRWGANEADRRRYAAELVALPPDVILASNSQATLALQAATSTVPIVFAKVTDPVAAGFVQSLARPGGNATGFTLFEYGISAKWLELLKEIAPGVDASGRHPGCGGERAADPLHCPAIDSELFGNDTHTGSPGAARAYLNSLRHLRSSLLRRYHPADSNCERIRSEHFLDFMKQRHSPLLRSGPPV